MKNIKQNAISNGVYAGVKFQDIFKPNVELTSISAPYKKHKANLCKTWVRVPFGDCGSFLGQYFHLSQHLIFGMNDFCLRLQL